MPSPSFYARGSADGTLTPNSRALEFVNQVRSALTITPAMSEAEHIPDEQVAVGVKAAAAAGVVVSPAELRVALAKGVCVCVWWGGC